MESYIAHFLTPNFSRKMLFLFTPLFFTGHCAFSQELKRAYVLLVAHSNFIFKGTIIQPDSSNVNVHSTGRKAIVKVDQVLDAPKLYSNLVKGKEITVFFADTASHNRGDQSTYYTSIWYVGKTLGVNEVKNSLTPSDLNVPQTYIQRARNQIADDSLGAKLKHADVIVVQGIVIDPMTDSSKKYELRSEHNPEFVGATITVRQVLKGHLSQPTIRVYYANSSDVFWYKCPKLSKNMSGIFLLHRGENSPFHLPGYYILDDRDIQTNQQLNKINYLLTH